MLETYFRALINGERKGIGADTMRSLLAALSLPYAGVVGTRNKLYDRGWLPVYPVPVPVLSVGNLTLGGTGKTPFVAHLLQWSYNRQLQPGVISRGYKRTGQQTLNDEGMELALRFPGLLQEQSPDRVHAAGQLLKRNRVDLLILDDGFQHRRIKRDLDIVLLDAREPFGHDCLFPRGTLRESVRSLSRAQIAVLSRADLISSDEKARIRQKVFSLNPQLLWAEVIQTPTQLVSFFDESPQTDSQIVSDLSSFSVQRSCSIEWLRERKILAFCGIAQPEVFKRTLKKCKTRLAELVVFPDHHAFENADLEQLVEVARKHQVEAIICTMKDLVKIRRQQLGSFPLWAVGIGVEFLEGEAEFNARLEQVLREDAVFWEQ
ncbi:MAG: tetraacyldisaccharide 4'-kinase [Thermoguttaceae bacterium]